MRTLRKPKRTKAFIGAIFSTIGNIAGAAMNASQQKQLADEKEAYLQSEENRKYNTSLVQAMNPMLQDRGVGEEFKSKLSYKKGGKIKCDEGAKLETAGGNYNMGMASDSGLSGIVGGIMNMFAAPILASINEQRLITPTTHNAPVFGGLRDDKNDNVDTNPNVNQGSPIQFGDRLQQAKCGIKIKRRG